MRSIISIISFFILPSYAVAITVIDLNYWKCTAIDAEHKEWEGHSDYQLASINKAFEACKRESQAPTSCKTSKQHCELIVNGMTTRPIWRCMALDEAASLWYSTTYNHAGDALLAAKAYCQANSALPDTCYVYNFNCRNLNQRTL